MPEQIKAPHNPSHIDKLRDKRIENVARPAFHRALQRSSLGCNQENSGVMQIKMRDVVLLVSREVSPAFAQSS